MCLSAGMRSSEGIFLSQRSRRLTYQPWKSVNWWSVKLYITKQVRERKICLKTHEVFFLTHSLKKSRINLSLDSYIKLRVCHFRIDCSQDSVCVCVCVCACVCVCNCFVWYLLCRSILVTRHFSTTYHRRNSNHYKSPCAGDCTRNDYQKCCRT